MIAPKYMYWSKPFTKIPSWLNKFDHKIITLLGIFTMGGFYTKPVQAENFPPPEILEQLKENILQEIVPVCVICLML